MKTQQPDPNAKKKKAKPASLKDLLMRTVPFLNPQYAEHALKAVNADPNKKVED